MEGARSEEARDQGDVATVQSKEGICIVYYTDADVRYDKIVIHGRQCQ